MNRIFLEHKRPQRSRAYDSFLLFSQ